jgi:DNA polymerase-4
MHCIAALNLDGFYIFSLGTEAAPASASLVIVKEKYVLDASPLARQTGVLVGQTVAEAKAILGKTGTFIDWTPDRFQAASERWLNIAAEFTRFVEPLSQQCALLDLSEHPNPMKTATELRQAVQRTFPVSVSAGIGPCRWIAQADCTPNDLSITPLLTPRAYIRPFSTLRLEPIEWKERERLMALGYRTIGDVSTLSFQTLTQLFGKRAFLIHQAAQGGGNPTVLPTYPKDSCAENVCFKTAPENWDEIVGACKSCAQSLAQALVNKDLNAYEVEIVLTFEDGERLSQRRTYTQPISNARGIERAVSMMIREPFPKPLERLIVRLNNLQRAGCVQRTFDGVVNPAERTIALERAVKSLRATFGTCSVERAAAIPRARFQEVRRAWQEVNGFVWR